MPRTQTLKRRAALVGATALAAGLVPATAEAGCKTFSERAKIESSIVKTDLAYMYIRVRVCTNGKKVTKVSPLEVEPVLTKNAINMEWKKDQLQTIEHYETWNHQRKGSYFVKATGVFNQTILAVSTNTTVRASIRVTGDGRVVKWNKTG